MGRCPGRGRCAVEDSAARFDRPDLRQAAARRRRRGRSGQADDRWRHLLQCVECRAGREDGDARAGRRSARRLLAVRLRNRMAPAAERRVRSAGLAAPRGHGHERRPDRRPVRPCAARRRHAARPQDREVQRTPPPDSRALQASAGAPYPVSISIRLMTLLGKFLRRSRADRFLLVHAALLHAAIAIGCRVLPLASLAALLARAYPHRVSADGAGSIDSRALWAAATAAAFWPSSGTCLSHALTARCLLRRFGCETALRIGVRRGTTSRLDSHAWLERAGAVVVGGDPAGFVPIWGG